MRTIDSLINVAGDQLYVQLTEKDNSKPTIVFLHDSLGCTALWRNFPHKLAEATGCNFLIYDRKGYGRSDPMQTILRTQGYLEKEAEVLHDLLAQLGLTKVILFGHSDGGSIALIAAARYPLIMEAIIAEAAHIFVEPETVTGIRAAVERYQHTDLGERLSKYHGEKSNAVFHAWTETWLSDAYQSWNIESYLPRIVCPTLIIQGEEDEYGTIKQVEGIARKISGRGDVFLLPETGHTPHKEAPVQVLEKARQFIEVVCRGRHGQ